MSALTPGQTIALLRQQHTVAGWKYGDMLTAGVFGPCMYLRRATLMGLRVAIDGPRHVVLPLATDGSVLAGFNQIVEEREMTYLPDPVPSSATAGGSR